jgi:hypothetical protein
MKAHFYAAGFIAGTVTPLLFNAIGWWNLAFVAVCGDLAGWLAGAPERRS